MPRGGVEAFWAKKNPELPEKLGGELARQRPTLPQGRPCSTIGSEELDFRVRYGIGYGLFDITTGKRWASQMRTVLASVLLLR